MLLAPLGPINGLGAPAALNAPIWGKCLRLMGLVDCRRENALRTMARGRTIGLLPGGISEIFFNSADIECMYIRKRKGFVKLALRSGRPLVPCYTFGNTQVFHCFGGKRLKKISELLRACVTVFWGRWFLPVPFRVPLTCIIGEPMPVDKWELGDDTVADRAAFDAEVDRVHGKFLEAMHELFERHKSHYGWDHKSLLFY
jgi:2-acylglycerol O-acyltransferase 2